MRVMAINEPVYLAYRRANTVVSNRLGTVSQSRKGVNNRICGDVAPAVSAHAIGDYEQSLVGTIEQTIFVQGTHETDMSARR
jgi:hypothetical protein